MPYATIQQSAANTNLLKHPGWRETNTCVKKYFSNDTVNLISRKITELLQGVDPEGRDIIVPNSTIAGIMSEIYSSFRPPTGDIYSRFNIPSGEPSNYVQSMIDQVIEIITSDVQNNLGIEENNRKLTAWTTVLGTFNEHGLRSHDELKIRKKNTNHRGMVSFMNY